MNNKTNLLKGLAAGATALLLVFTINALWNWSTAKPTSTDIAARSVKVVRPDGRSGGSGVILTSSPSFSTVLTNSHVCGVIENGGSVINESGEHAVTSYKKSKYHDLCLVTVAADLKASTDLAASAPALDSYAAVAGHPRLLPTIITEGNFSERQMIEVMTGLRACTKEDIQTDPRNAILCMYLGGLPVITRYESQVISSLIQPGSSGSPVFNAQGNLSGLVFAGSGALSFGFIVPYEAVANFVRYEAPGMNPTLPNNSYEINDTSMFGPTLRKRMNKLCNTTKVNLLTNVKRICEIYKSDLIWLEE